MNNFNPPGKKKYFPRLHSAIILFCPVVVLSLSSCHSSTDNNSGNSGNTPKVLPQVPQFNADSAYAFVNAQCDFGPRVPNSKQHDDCALWLESKLKTYTPNVIVQTGIVAAYDGSRLHFKNLIASFNPDNHNRVLLFAHWDTRPWADQDSIRPTEPILGADDGGSGVGVLLEIARQLSIQMPLTGVDIAFFDAEDWGMKGSSAGSEDSYALGTQYWTKNPHVPNYSANYGVLLDMVGAKQAVFRMEGNSKEYAGFAVERIWKTAIRLGFSNYFLYEDGGWVTDDHVYVNKINIPSIDIINSNTGTKSGFPTHWHTHHDTMEIIDRNTLRAVGQTLLTVIYSEGSL